MVCAASEHRVGGSGANGGGSIIETRGPPITIQETLIDRLKKAMPELRQHSVPAVWIFCSVARGDAHDDSDVDILVDFNRPVSLFHMARVHRRLEEILGRKVDLVSRDGLRPALRDQILSEAIRAA